MSKNYNKKFLGNYVAKKIEANRKLRDDKIELLNSLMTLKKNDEESRTPLAMALNLVDVVFHDSEKIKASYHAYRVALLSRQHINQLNDLFVQLVRDISSELGYHIDGTDIDRCVGYDDLTYIDSQKT